MKIQRTNSTFASSNTQADTSACKRAIPCLLHGAENKRTASKTKQPFQLTNFNPFGSTAPWTWGESIGIIIKSDYLSTLYAFVAPLTGFFSSCVHNTRFKSLTTCSTLNVERLLTTFLGWTDLYFFSNRSCWSSCCLFLRNKLSCSSISNSCRRFTHFRSVYELKLCSQLKGLKAYPLNFNFIYIYGKA